MGRLSNEAKAERARQSLIQTIAAIEDLEPTLGGKWRKGMLNYYTNRLAELVLYQCGFRQPSINAIKVLQSEIVSLLLPDGDDGW